MPYDPLFNKAYDYMRHFEGALSNQPHDKGGVTNQGISYRFYKKLYPNARPSDVEVLSQDEAKRLYHQYFWRDSFNMLPDIIAVKLFDVAVNMGNKMAVIIAQRALCGVGQYVKDDGILGNKTKQAINNVSSRILLACICTEQAAYYRLLMHHDSTQKKFARGWLRRAYSRPHE